MPDWIAVAHARGLDIPDDAIEKIASALDALEAEFAPLRARLTPDIEPAAPAE